MNSLVRKLFEAHTVPNFGLGFDPDLSKNSKGEYTNGSLEDHWQTFQEAVELAAEECIYYLNSEIDRLYKYQQSISPEDAGRRDDVDLVVEKCYDNIEGIRQHFGIQ